MPSFPQLTVMAAAREEAQQSGQLKKSSGYKNINVWPILETFLSGHKNQTCFPSGYGNSTIQLILETFVSGEHKHKNPAILEMFSSGWKTNISPKLEEG